MGERVQRFTTGDVKLGLRVDERDRAGCKGVGAESSARVVERDKSRGVIGYCSGKFYGAYIEVPVTAGSRGNKTFVVVLGGDKVVSLFDELTRREG